MSQGKYSPNFPHRNVSMSDFTFNAKGEVPPEYVPGTDQYDQEIHFGDYDEEGYDMYGYSAYDAEGNFIGTGNGVDRNGFTESDYLSMTEEEFQMFL